MNENENLSCELPHKLTNWETILWRKVIQHVNRLQRRIAKAVKQGRWAKAKALMYLVTKSFYVKLLAVLRVSTNKGGNTPGIDNIVGTNAEEKLEAVRKLRSRGHFTDQRISKKGTENHRLYRIGYVPIRYHVKEKEKANPFLSEFDTYFANRTKQRKDLAKECRQITTFISTKKSNNSRVVLHRISL